VSVKVSVPRPEDEASRSRFAKQRMLSPVTCCASSRHFAEAIRTLLRPGDVCLEIGYDQLGPVTPLIARAIGPTGHLAGIKRHGAVMSTHKKKSPEDMCPLEVASLTTTHLPDGLWNVSALQSFGSVTAVVCDFSSMHGNDLLSDSISFVQLLRATYDASLRTVIFRSRALTAHATSYITDSFFSAKKTTPQGDPKGYFAKALKELDSIFPSYPLPPRNPDSPNGMAARICIPTGRPCIVMPFVISAIGVANYREMMHLTCLTHSRVMEIGCADGPTCRLLVGPTGPVGPCGFVLGVDVGKECIYNARKFSTALPHNLVYEIADAWDTPRLVQLEPDVDVIFLDMGGLSSVDGVSEALSLCRVLTHAYIRTLRFIIVKSRCLRDHSRSLLVQPAVESESKADALSQ